MPKMGLKMREIGFQRTYIFKIFRGSMPPDPPRKVRLRRTITFSITYEHPLENLSYAPEDYLIKDHRFSIMQGKILVMGMHTNITNFNFVSVSTLSLSLI